MFAREDRYTAAYTHRTGSHDSELAELASWVTGQEGEGLLLVGASAKSLDRSEVARGLTKRGARFTHPRERGWGGADRVIALWPDRKTLGEVDALPVRVLAVLTWNLDEVMPWVAGVGAVDVLGEAPTDAGPEDIDDHLALGVLRSITNSANLSTGLSHTSDFNYALAALKVLTAQGRTLDRDAVEAWAVANGWSYRHAREDLGELVSELNAGKRKRFKGSGGSPLRPAKELVDHWREIGADPEWEPF